MILFQKVAVLAIFIGILILLFAGAVLAGTDITGINGGGPTLETHEAQNETCLTKNPGYPNNIVVAINDANGGVQVGPSLGINYSMDNGTSWGHTHIPYYSPSGATSTALMTFDPAVAADTQGNLYASYIQDEPSLYQPPVGVWISKSSNQGQSWEASPNAVRYYSSGNRYLDKSWLTVDTYSNSPYTDNIYVTWQEDDLVSAKYSWIYFAKSSSSNYPTFSTPIKVTENSRPTPYDNAPVPAVAPNGDIYIAWMDSDITNSSCPPGKIRLKKSTDGGVTFQAPSPWVGSATVASFNNAVQKFPFSGGFKQTSFPSIATDPTNSHNVYVVYAADPDGGDVVLNGGGPDRGDVYFVMSADSGSSWSTPKKISDDTMTAAQFQPQIKVKPNGYIDIVWMDGRNDSSLQGFEFDIYMTTSTDGGMTFKPNQKVSDLRFDTGQGGTGWVGEYLGLDVDTTNAYIAWTDTGIGQARPFPAFTPDRDIFFDIMPNPTNTPTGNAIATSIRSYASTITSNMATVTAVGNTSLSLTSATVHPAPAGYSFISGGSYYGYFDLTTTATFQGDITVDFNYDEAIVGSREGDLRFFHWNGLSWDDITTNLDTTGNTITGKVSSLSTFAIALPKILEPKSYLPNITKKYFDWTTPFIIQNLGSEDATVNVKFYKKGDSVSIYEQNYTGIIPGSSVGINPKDIGALGSTFQGSVVVYADQDVASIVNEHSPTCSMAYEGIDPADSTRAGTEIYLSNITRNYFGWNTPFVVQNLSSSVATINVEFYRNGESIPAFEETHTVSSNSSKGINPSTKPLGTFQGSVVIKSSQEISAIVNEHYGKDEAMSYNGSSSGSTNIYLPNITRDYFGWTTPFAIQNPGSLPLTITVEYYRKGIVPSVYQETHNLSAKSGIGINPKNRPLGKFQGSVIVKSNGQPIISVCNEHSVNEAMAYSGISQGEDKNFLPNITRNYFGWNTPFVVQNQYSEDEQVDIHFYNSSGSEVKHISGVNIPGGGSVGFNPANYSDLGSFKGSVVIESNSGKRLMTIVNEQHTSGQSMAYNGF